MTNTLLENIDKGLLTGLIFLFLSKAFGPLDHSIMLNELTSFGMNRSVVQWWLRSYLTMRIQSVGCCLRPSLYLYIYIFIELYADYTLNYFARTVTQ